MIWIHNHCESIVFKKEEENKKNTSKGTSEKSAKSIAEHIKKNWSARERINLKWEKSGLFNSYSCFLAVCYRVSIVKWCYYFWHLFSNSVVLLRSNWSNESTHLPCTWRPFFYPTHAWNLLISTSRCRPNAQNRRRAIIWVSKVSVGLLKVVSFKFSIECGRWCVRKSHHWKSCLINHKQMQTFPQIDGN